MTTNKKIVFLNCVDFKREDVKELLKILTKYEDYLFILSDKEIKSVDREELLRVIRG